LRFPRLQERFGDRLLTVLTILFALLLFVIAPLHAAGIVLSQDVGLAVAFVVIVTVLFAYGISVAVVMMLLGFGVALAATVLRHRHQTPLDLYLDARVDPPGPHFELRCRPCRVRARTHHLPSHHGSDSALPDDRRDLRRALHLRGLADSGFIFGHPLKDTPTFASTMVYFSFGTLTTAGSADISPLYPIARSLTNVEANDRPALSSNTVGADRDTRDRG
jgi:hypothetical protein